MPQISLITDLLTRDPFLGMVKSKLYALLPQAQVIDLSMGDTELDLISAVYILKTGLTCFPPGSIHMVALQNNTDRQILQHEWAPDAKRFLLCETASQFIITPDNGLVSLLGEDVRIYNLFYDNPEHSKFYLRDLFPHFAAALSTSQNADLLGVLTTSYARLTWPQPFVQGNVLKGQKIYEDAFGNLVTNITKDMFMQACPKGRFEVILPGAIITQLHAYYYDVDLGQPLLLFNTAGYLELAIRGQSAAALLIPRSMGSNRFFQIHIHLL